MKIKFLLCLIVMLFFANYTIYADEDVITGISYETIVIDKGASQQLEQLVYSVDISEFITPIPSDESLMDLNYSIADTSIASLEIQNGDIIIYGEKYGCTTLYVSNDNFSEIIDIYVVYPRSGSELDYSPSSWVSTEIRVNRNCYSYALNILENTSVLERNSVFDFFSFPGMIADTFKPQGAFSIGICEYCDNEDLKSFILNAKADFLAINKLNNIINSNYEDIYAFKCIDLNDEYEDLFEDLLGITDPNAFSMSCTTGTYKVVLVRMQDGGMHWYRQDSNGLWSHKNGRGYVTNYDSDNKLIFDPRTCAKTYSEGTYEYIGCFQVIPW